MSAIHLSPVPPPSMPATEAAILHARVARLEGALRQIAYGEFQCSLRQYGVAMQEFARTTLEGAP